MVFPKGKTRHVSAAQRDPCAEQSPTKLVRISDDIDAADALARLNTVSTTLRQTKGRLKKAQAVAKSARAAESTAESALRTAQAQTDLWRQRADRDVEVSELRNDEVRAAHDLNASAISDAADAQGEVILAPTYDLSQL